MKEVITENVHAIILLLILFVGFGLLKYFDYIPAPWWFIFVPIVCVFIFLVLLFILGLIVWILKRIKNG